MDEFNWNPADLARSALSKASMDLIQRHNNELINQGEPDPDVDPSPPKTPDNASYWQGCNKYQEKIKRRIKKKKKNPQATEEELDLSSNDENADLELESLTADFENLQLSAKEQPNPEDILENAMEGANNLFGMFIEEEVGRDKDNSIPRSESSIASHVMPDTCREFEIPVTDMAEDIKDRLTVDVQKAIEECYKVGEYPVIKFTLNKPSPSKPLRQPHKIAGTKPSTSEATAVSSNVKDTPAQTNVKIPPVPPNLSILKKFKEGFSCPPLFSGPAGQVKIGSYNITEQLVIQVCKENPTGSTSDILTKVLKLNGMWSVFSSQFEVSHLD